MTEQDLEGPAIVVADVGRVRLAQLAYFAAAVADYAAESLLLISAS